MEDVIMSSIVFYKNKKNGITYAYESVSYWDKELQQGRSKRTCIGHVDPETGEIVANRPKQSTPKTSIKKTGPVPVTESRRSFYGATFLFDSIGRKYGITEDLKKCFPSSYEQILSIAYYLILEDKNPLSRFPKWAATHKHPFGSDIPSQRSSDLFASITEEQRMNFFKLQGARRGEKECYAYDTTSISSYSKCLNQVQYGHNKEHDPLAQLNLALLFGEDSGLPFYYRQLPGNIPDSKTVKNLLEDLKFFGFEKIHAVMDRGFYSEDNINGMYKEHIKFLMGVRLSLAYVKKELDSHRGEIRNWNYYIPDYDTYGLRVSVEWKYTQERPYKKDTLKENRRMYIYFYYNGQRAADDERDFTIRMLKLSEELENGKRIPEHEGNYKKYFRITHTPKRGIKVQAVQDAMEDAKKNYGYFALVSNEPLDPVRALYIYKNKDLVEKAFCNIKERLDCRRLAVSSELSLNGKLFVEFVALIYLSYIKKKMDENHLYKKYTLQGLLDKLDIIECYERPGHSLRVGEMTEKQKELYNKLGFEPPT